MPADDITQLRNVRADSERKAAEEIAEAKRCEDFATFKPLFARVAADLNAGIRTTRPFVRDLGMSKAEIQPGEFFILGGQTAYVAEVSTEADITVLERQLDTGSRRITPAVLAGFGELLGRKLRGFDDKVRREYVHLLVDRVEVGDREIRISGRNVAIERAIIASQTPGAVVPKAERKWCTSTIKN